MTDIIDIIFNDINSNLISSNFQQKINYIKTLDQNNYDKLIKWKDLSHQAVIQTNQYFYKIYQIYDAQQFFQNIRLQLAKIYRQDYGIDWQIITIKKNNIIYQIEKRQKLQILSQSDFTIDEIISEWKKTLQKLQKKMYLDNIRKQLKLHEDLKQIEYLKIVRQCINKHSDYAIKNGHIILIDDSDFTLLMADKNKNIITKNFQAYVVSTKYGQLLFAPNDIDFNDLNSKYTDMYIKWMLYNVNQKILSQILKLDFNSILFDQFQHDIKLLI